MFSNKSEKSQPDGEEKSEALKILIANISGYLGYKKQEFRKQSDVAFRKKVLNILQESGDLISQVQELLIHSQLLTTWGPAGMISKLIADLRKEVSDTDYEYSTFFDIKVIEEGGIDLSILYMLEIDIIDSCEEFRDTIKNILEKLEEMYLEGIENEINRLLMNGRSFASKLNDRNELIRSFEMMNL